jgi:hypothetical protein
MDEKIYINERYVNERNVEGRVGYAKGKVCG